MGLFYLLSGECTIFIIEGNRKDDKAEGTNEKAKEGITVCKLCFQQILDRIIARMFRMAQRMK